MLLIAHDIVTRRRNWSIPALDEPEDPWRSVFDDIQDWLSGPRAAVILVVIGAFMFSTGTYVAANQTMKSTYICFPPLDSRPQVIFFQYVGLVIDATIIVLLWRVLVWTRNLKLRLRTLSNIFLISSLFISFLWISTSMFSRSPRPNLGFGFLYGFDVVVDSFAFAMLAISLSIWMCESTPVVSTAVMTFLSGIWRSGINILSFGDWMHLSRSASLGPLWLTSIGSSIFIYAYDVRSIVFIRRILFVFLIGALLITATVITFVGSTSQFENRHPINDLIYEARAIHDRWLVKAGTSTTLATAVVTYGERHKGRAPPPRFGDWYQYASGSTVIDEFRQIDDDLDIFWSVSPATLRKRVQSAAENVGVGRITVKDGLVTSSDLGDESKNLDLRELSDMIKKFSRHLPDMVLPVNLSPGPRVLPSWTDTQLHSQGYLQSMAKVISKRSENSSASDVLGSRHQGQTDISQTWHQTWASDFRQMHTEACPSASRARTNPHWDIGTFCSGCVKEHSSGQLLNDWAKSLDVCSQPDLNHLHGFAMTDPSVPPIRELVPLFGSSKTTGFRDILVPLAQSRLYQSDDGEPFSKRKDALFWRGAVGGHAINAQAIRGSHKLRLLHLIKYPNVADRVTMILPVPAVDDKFRSEVVPVVEANRDLSFNFGIDDFSACMGKNCDIIKQTYGAEIQTDNPLQNRYVLLTDEDNGPPTQTLKMLRSQSLPFISTIFQTWYSDRITPWLHFVPIDTRYHALHTTLLYFTGTANKAKMNGINTYLSGRFSDGEWVAQQGQRWANKALGKRDMEIYLFRLLLEWGRLIDDRRDVIGYRKEANGEFQSDEWSRAS